MRQPKPFFRKFTQSWYVTIRGKQFPLGKDKAAAWQRYHEIMASQASIDQLATVAQLCDVYLEWCEKHRKNGTFIKHQHYLQSFIRSIGKRLKIAKLRKKHLTAWIDSLNLATTSQNDAMGIVIRVFNWAMEEGHIDRSPLARIKKPPRKRREVVYSLKQWEKIRSHVPDEEFGDLLDFLWATGCRPNEVRILEAQHVDLRQNIAILPPSLAKGEEHERVIFLNQEARAIIAKLIVKNPDGPLFVNQLGNPWTSDTIKCRMTRISKKVGFRVIAYGIRHAFATEGLKNGVDSIVLGHLMGHADASMVAKTYSHLARELAYLGEQAERVRTKPTAH